MKKFIVSALAAVVMAGAFTAQAQDDKAAAKAIKEAQKALDGNLKQAKKLSEDPTKPDFAGARAQIAEAQKNSQAAANAGAIGLAAGNVEYAQFNYERNKPATGGTMNEETVLSTAVAGYEYYAQAYEAYKQPDAKGKVNTKFNAEIQQKAFELFRTTGGFRANAGSAYGNQDWKNAYKFFDMSLAATDSEMLKSYCATNPVAQLDMDFYQSDSTRNQSAFNRAVVAIYMEDHPLAIQNLEYMKDKNYETNLVFQSLAREYVANDSVNGLPDSTKLIALLEEGAKLMPNEPWYSQNLMNVYLDRKDYESAAKSIDGIVALDPNNANYVALKGQLLEMQGNPDEALACYQKALELDPAYGNAYSYIGRIYYNRATDRENELYDQKKYDIVDRETAPLYDEALPWYEKAFAFDTEHKDTSIPQALRTILYRKFQKPSCPNKKELQAFYNEVSEAYNLPTFK